MRTDSQTDGQMGMTKLTVALRNFANASNEKIGLHKLTENTWGGFIRHFQQFYLDNHDVHDELYNICDLRVDQ
jgi:hypothetical protein